jgi:tRNA(adenine34) deaminase
VSAVRRAARRANATSVAATTGRPQRRPNVAGDPVAPGRSRKGFDGPGVGSCPRTLRGVTDDDAMGLALEEAEAAALHGDVPVGAVLLSGEGHVLARRHNERELLGDPTAHAELLALRDGAAAIGGWRLTGTTLVVTLEPCPMCAGALVAGRVARLVFGAADPKAGACGSLYNLCVDPRLNHEVAVAAGVGADRAAALLAGFFTGRREP